MNALKFGLALILLTSAAVVSAQLSLANDFDLATPFSYPSDIVTLDIDSDGDEDFIVSSLNDNKVVLYTTSPQGLEATQLHGEGSSLLLDPSALEFGDIDNDGDDDLVVLGFRSNNVVIYENQHGHLVQFSELKVAAPFDCELADINGDQALDLLLTLPGTDMVLLKLNDGTGQFTQTLEVANGPGLTPLAIEAADIDSDGEMDLLFTSMDAAEGGIYLLKDEQGIFETSKISNSPTRNLRVEDLDGDGQVEIIACGENKFEKVETAWAVTILAMQSDGSFKSEIIADSENNQLVYPTELEVADFNGDGIKDIAVGSSGASEYEAALGVVLGSDSSWTFESVASSASVTALGLADFDQDGQVEMLVGNPGKISHYLNAAPAVATGEASATETSSKAHQIRLD